MRIMVVEDDVMVRGSILEILQTADYEVVSANNGAAALDNFTENLPDLIISDIMMPVMDGYTFYNSVRETSFGIDIPFIFLTARADFGDVRYGMNLGADDYITKPFKAKDLLEAVNVRLTKKMRQKNRVDEIALSIAKYVPHELRTPLVSILGYSECIINDHSDFSDSEILSMISQVKISGERLLSRIEKFITFAELNNQQLNPQFCCADEKEFDIAKMLTELLEQQREKFPYVNFKTNFDVKIVTGSGQMFTYVLSELIENAFKFFEAGSIEKVEVSTQEHKNGCKIDITNSSEFFIPYSRIEDIPLFMQFNRDEKQQIGNGIGLSIARKVCELCDIKSVIKSERGKTRISLLINPQSKVKGEI